MFTNFNFKILNFDFMNKFNYFFFKQLIKIEKIRIKIYSKNLTFKNLLLNNLILQYFSLKKKSCLIKILNQIFFIKVCLILRYINKIASSILLIKNNFSFYNKKNFSITQTNNINIVLINKLFNKMESQFLIKNILKIIGEWLNGKSVNFEN